MGIVIMLYEDPTKAISSDERFHVELHFSPGVNCCVQKENVPGPGFNPKSKFLRHDSIAEKPCCIQTSIGESITPPTPFTASFNCNKNNLDRILEKNSDTEVSSDGVQKLTENFIDSNYSATQRQNNIFSTDVISGLSSNVEDGDNLVISVGKPSIAPLETLH